MASPAKTSSAFPSPYEVETPPGCEGWEEMYPYHALFHEARREAARFATCPGEETGKRKVFRLSAPGSRCSSIVS